jgi:pimeloyl-ACP methyl ester carboxylesterase
VPFVTVNAVRLHIQELGEGPPVVMIHGLLVGSLASWYFTAAPALSRTHRVILYDLRGHGMSDRPSSGYSVKEQTRDLEALVDALGLGSIALAGHSFGALVALRFALDHGDRVSKVVLVEPPLPPSRFEEFDSFLRLPAEQMIDALPASQRRALGEGRRPARRLVEKILRLAGETSLLSDLRAEPDIPDETLASLRCPALCLMGSTSSLRPVGDRLARVIPGSQRRVLEGGHYLHLDATEAVTRSIDEFLRV